jgi:hypothetical protein
MQTILLCRQKGSGALTVTVVAAGFPFNPDVPSRAA